MFGLFYFARSHMERDIQYVIANNIFFLKKPPGSSGYIKETDTDSLATILSIILTDSQKLSLHFMTPLS